MTLQIEGLGPVTDPASLIVTVDGVLVPVRPAPSAFSPAQQCRPGLSGVLETERWVWVGQVSALVFSDLLATSFTVAAPAHGPVQPNKMPEPCG